MLYNIFIYLISFIILISSIVFIHELGHFLFARWNGVRVDAFSIGFGKEIFGWNDKHGTRWKVAWIPLGGYVKMFGQADMPEDEKEAQKILDKLSDEEKQQHFEFKKRWQKISIIVAGPLFNFIFAFLIFFASLLIWGEEKYESRLVKSVHENAPAFVYLQEGDKILEINDTKVERFDEIQKMVLTSEGKELTLKLDRDGKNILRRVVPERENENAPYLLGYTPEFRLIEVKTYSFGAAFVQAGIQIKDITGEMVVGIVKLFSGKESMKNVGGIISIGGIAKQSLEAGLAVFLSIIALISINLGVVNLIPLPVLDGGHIFILTIESIVRRDLPAKIKLALMNAGVVFLLLLLLLSVFNDVIRIIG